MPLIISALLKETRAEEKLLGDYSKTRRGSAMPFPAKLQRTGLIAHPYARLAGLCQRLARIALTCSRHLRLRELPERSRTSLICSPSGASEILYEQAAGEARNRAPQINCIFEAVNAKI
jgi:hypothetical protein